MVRWQRMCDDNHASEGLLGDSPNPLKVLRTRMHFDYPMDMDD